MIKDSHPLETSQPDTFEWNSSKSWRWNISTLLLSHFSMFRWRCIDKIITSSCYTVVLWGIQVAFVNQIIQKSATAPQLTNECSATGLSSELCMCRSLHNSANLIFCTRGLHFIAIPAIRYSEHWYQSSYLQQYYNYNIYLASRLWSFHFWIELTQLNW